VPVAEGEEPQHFFSLRVADPDLAALAQLLAVAAAAGLLGKGRLQRAAPPLPKEAVDSIKTDIEEIRERALR